MLHMVFLPVHWIHSESALILFSIPPGPRLQWLRPDETPWVFLLYGCHGLAHLVRVRLAIVLSIRQELYQSSSGVLIISATRWGF
jgi:hypothetical protein